MKKIILILLLTATSAWSEVIATTTNGLGGKIALTDLTCTNTTYKGKIAYATSPTSKTLLGCWLSDNTMIHIFWDDGEMRSYPFGIWELTDEARKGKGT